MVGLKLLILILKKIYDPSWNVELHCAGVSCSVFLMKVSGRVYVDH